MNDIIKKPWGYEQIVSWGRDNSLSKNLVVYSGEALSLQMHHKRDEEWIVKHGTCWITLEHDRFKAFPGTHWHIPPKMLHRIEAITDTVIEEMSTNYEEDDIVRIEDKYKR